MLWIPLTVEASELQDRLRNVGKRCDLCGHKEGHAPSCIEGVKAEAERRDGKTVVEKIERAEQLASFLAELWDDPWNGGSQHQRLVADYLRGQHGGAK